MDKLTITTSPDEVTVVPYKPSVIHERQMEIKISNLTTTLTSLVDTPLLIEKNDHKVILLQKGNSITINNSETVYVVKEVPNVKVTVEQKVVTKTIHNTTTDWNNSSSAVLPLTILPKSLPFEDEGRYCLAFPSISTAAYKFDIDRAAVVATEVIRNFLKQHPEPQIRLYLVDLTESETLEKFRKATEDIKDSRFQIVAVDIVKLRDFGIPCWYIVNASNPGFKSTGSGTNRAIHKASEGNCKDLRQLTLAKYKPPAEVGVPYPVEMVPGSPLRDQQNVHVVIHVVGPNMSIKRANYLFGNYEEGERLLKKAYTGLLNSFYEKTGLATRDRNGHNSASY